ncbi:hypothetical protein ASD11_00730 [Aeromicrobium sp. Root495]|nr:hypothetical protein ASD11_00730 [Aeromicrobium sp. Root495]
MVERFYAAVSGRDADALTAIVDDHFVADASIEWPVSLPYGGRVEGARILRKIFAGMAAAESPVGPTALRVRSVTADDSGVVAELVFTYVSPSGGPPVPSGALERWCFDGDKVRTIRAYYWDTAALVATQPAPAPHDPEEKS